jgi:hypothetical protein
MQYTKRCTVLLSIDSLNTYHRSNWADTAGFESAVSVVSPRLNATEIAPYHEESNGQTPAVAVAGTVILYVRSMDTTVYLRGNEVADKVSF